MFLAFLVLNTILSSWMITPITCGLFSLRHKSYVFQTLANFHSYVRNQFSSSIQAIQCDNGREFDNTLAHQFLSSHIILLHLSCPYTSQQNNNAKRTLWYINNVVCTLLFQASMLPQYWAEALHAATLLFNLLPTTTLHMHKPHENLFHTPPSYSHLCVFDCLCYPNLLATAPIKLALCSVSCVFLGYPSNHKGYHCLDLSSHHVIISCHVIFDGHNFPFACSSPPRTESYDLVNEIVTSPPPLLSVPVVSPTPPAALASPTPHYLLHPLRNVFILHHLLLRFASYAHSGQGHNCYSSCLAEPPCLLFLLFQACIMSPFKIPIGMLLCLESTMPSLIITLGTLCRLLPMRTLFLENRSFVTNVVPKTPLSATKPVGSYAVFINLLEWISMRLSLQLSN